MSPLVIQPTDDTPKVVFDIDGTSFEICIPLNEEFQTNSVIGVVFENHDRYDTSNVEFADGEIKVYDKKNQTPAMHHIDYGLGLFRAAAFDGFARHAVVDLSSVQQALVARRQLVGYEIPERFYEIGSHEGIQELDTLLRKPTP